MLEINKIYCMDCRERMKLIEDKSIDLVIADPPYNIGGNGKPSVKWETKKIKTVKEKWDIFNESSFYKFNLVWISECKRILKDNGNILIFGNKDNIYEVGYILKKLNFDIKNHIIWFKRNSPPNVTCRTLTHSCEHIIWAVNGKKNWTFNYWVAKELNGGKQQRDLYDIPMILPKEKVYGKHPAQKPLELIKRLVLTFSNEGDLVLDPFMGSGTTAVACKMFNRNFIGFEINEDYCDIAEKRIKNISKTEKNEEKQKNKEIIFG